MREIQWAERYRTGVPFVDAQHQELFRAVARIQESLARQLDEQVLRLQLEELLSMLKHHFRDEEGFLQHHGYPDLLEHIAEHTALLGELEQIAQRYQQSAAPLASMMGTFLGGWLRHHISEGDFRYARFLKERGIKTDPAPPSVS